MRCFVWLCIMELILCNCLIAEDNESKVKFERMLDKGREYINIGSYDMAMETLEKLSESDAGGSGLEALYELYHITGKYERALETARKISQKTENYRGHLLTGEVLMELGRYAQAKEALLEAYRLNRDNIRVQFGIGRYYFLHGQREKYLDYLGNIFDRYDPYRNYSAEELIYIAKACRIYAMKMSNDKLDRSDTLRTIVQDMLPEAISKDKYCFEAYRDMAEIFLDGFNMPDAKSILEDAFKLNANHPHLLQTQAAYQMQVFSLRPQVLSTLQQACKINPNLVDAFDLEVALYLSDEEYDKAQKTIEKALGVNPNHLPTLSLLASFYYMQGRKTAYENECKKVLAINPSYGDLYFTVGAMVLHKRQFTDAVELNRKAIELDPYLWHAYIEVGRHLLNIGEDQEAAKYLSKVQQEYNFHTQSHNTLLLLKKYGEFKTYQTQHFKIRLHISEAEAMLPVVSGLLENAYSTLTKQYQFEPENPVLFEMFPTHDDFSVRTIGLDSLGATGACFGKVVAVNSPRAMPKGSFNWASVVWHEFTHVITLQTSGYQIPRWFTEGLSEFAEKQRNPACDRKLDLELYSVYCSGAFRGIADLNAGFTRPRYPQEIMICYYQAKLICEFIDEKYGFPKILQMLELYRREKKDQEVLQTVLGLTMQEFDTSFVAWLKENVFGKMHVFPSINPQEIGNLQDRIWRNPQDIEAYVKLTLGYLQQRKFTDAGIYAGRLLELTPEQAIGYDVMGYLAHQMGNAKQAKILLEKAVLLGSNNFYTHWALGMLYWHQLKDSKRAIEAFEKAKASYPGYVRINNPYQKLAEIYFAQNSSDRALTELEAYLSKQEMDFATRIDLANRYLKTDRHKDTLRLLKEARDIYPLDIQVYELAIKASKSLREWDEALDAAKIALELTPKKDKAPVLIELAEIYYEKKQLEQAKSYAQKALELQPKDERAIKLLEKMNSR